jgi:glucose-6-phosphate-specific signal transduction histidine kinase
MLFVCGLILMSLALLFQSADASLILAYQPYIISYSLVAILVGALVNENNGMQQQLLLQNNELEVKNTALQTLNTKIQGIAERMTQVRENERKVLSQTLHDEFGQSITAMKLGIYIVEQKSPDVDLESLAIVKKNAEEMYNNVYDYCTGCALE